MTCSPDLAKLGVTCMHDCPCQICYWSAREFCVALTRPNQLTGMQTPACHSNRFAFEPLEIAFLYSPATLSRNRCYYRVNNGAKAHIHNSYANSSTTFSTFCSLRITFQGLNAVLMYTCGCIKYLDAAISITTEFLNHQDTYPIYR